MARSVNATSSLVPPANNLVKATLPAEHAVTQLESLAVINTCDLKGFGAGADKGAGLAMAGIFTGAGAGLGADPGAEITGASLLAAAAAGNRMRFADGPNRTTAKAAAVQRAKT